MRAAHLLPVAVLVASSIGPRLFAQGTPGGFVRVSHDAACCENPLTGTLLRATDDSIWIRPGGAQNAAAPVTLPRQSVRSFEHGEQVGSQRLGGAVAGFVIGVVAGAAIGTASMCHQCDGYGGFAQLSGVMLGGPVGLLAGILIGSRIPRYGWQQSPVPRHVGFAPMPHGGMQVQVSLGH